MFFKLLFLLSIYEASSFRNDSNYEKETFDLDNARNIFDEFIKKFEKHYDTKKEYYRRLHIFKNNLKDVNNRNKNSNKEVYGITQFMDQTEEELNRDFNTFKLTPDLEDLYEDPDFDDLQPLIRHHGHHNNHVPDSWDWRKKGVVTPARNQGQCGSCWAFSAIACAESQYAIKHKRLKALSEQQLLDCSKGPGCFGGYPHAALNDQARSGGLMKRENYYYVARRGRCRFNRRKTSVRINGAKLLRISDENRLKKLVYEYGPVSVGIVSTPGFAQYRGGISTPMGLGCTILHRINHVVVIVGYGKQHGVPYWIIKNSHGRGWGEHGFMKLIRGINACKILHYVSVADVP